MKSLLFLVFLISFHSCGIIDQIIGNISKEKIFDNLVEFLKGFSGNNDSKCVKVFFDDSRKEEEKYNKKLINITSRIIDMMKNKEDFEQIINKVGIDLITTPNLARYCNLLDAIKYYPNISEVFNIDFNDLDYVQVFLDYADEIYSFFKEKSEKGKEKDNLFFSLGGYLAKKTNFTIR